MRRASPLSPAFYLCPWGGVLEFDSSTEELEDASGRVVIACADGEDLVFERVEFR